MCYMRSSHRSLKHVAVEQDPTVIDALEKKKAANGGGFQIGAYNSTSKV